MKTWIVSSLGLGNYSRKETTYLQKLKLSKHLNRNKSTRKMVFFNEKFFQKDLDHFWHKIFESQDFAMFDDFYLTESKTKKLFIGACYWHKGLPCEICKSMVIWLLFQNYFDPIVYQRPDGLFRKFTFWIELCIIMCVSNSHFHDMPPHVTVEYFSYISAYYVW